MIVVGPSGEKNFVFRLGETLAEVEEQVFRLVFENNNGNRTKTARALGIALRTCRNKVKAYKMFEEDEEEIFGQDEDRIPGDNDKPSEEKWPSNTDAPVNLTKLPDTDKPTSKDLGGD